jgi:hypothetical protein
MNAPDIRNLQDYLAAVCRPVRYVLLAYVAGQDANQFAELARRLGVDADVTAARGDSSDTSADTAGGEAQTLWQMYADETDALRSLSSGTEDFTPTYHRLCESCELNPFESFALAFALAMDMDAACASVASAIFGKPAVSSVMQLFSSSPAENAAWLAALERNRRKLSALFIGIDIGIDHPGAEPFALTPETRRRILGVEDIRSQSIDVAFTWEDIVMPPEQLALLHHICDQVRYRDTVYEAWGFGRKLAYGRGVRALFSGPPGTGKTMAAQIIAGDLGMELQRVNISSLVSKYIGDTERNIDAAFTRAQSADSVLFFDEADALFGKRGEQKDSHDKYANMQTAYLLQRFEDHDGVVILATNYASNLDAAFLRRIQNRIDFARPTLDHRKLIWQSLKLKSAPWSDDADMDFLSTFELTGSEIKNIILQAAFLAAKAEEPIGMKELITALRMELEKMSRIVDKAAYGEYVYLLAE